MGRRNAIHSGPVLVENANNTISEKMLLIKDKNNIL